LLKASIAPLCESITGMGAFFCVLTTHHILETKMRRCQMAQFKMARSYEKTIILDTTDLLTAVTNSSIPFFQRMLTKNEWISCIVLLVKTHLIVVTMNFSIKVRCPSYYITFDEGSNKLAQRSSQRTVGRQDGRQPLILV
jgi:hypothetical protein